MEWPQPTVIDRLAAFGEGWSWVVLSISLAVFSWLFLPIVPGGGGLFGNDYALHFPNLLAGYFHFLTNGPLSVPWFNPAQCGGVPFLADPNVAYYSLPQWAAFAVGPVAAVQATFVVFAGLGAAGFYLLTRTRFDLSRPASLTAALLFLFNGFFAYRMAVGHLTFHPFALTPWLAFLALPPARDGGAVSWTWPRGISAAVLGAAILAYEFHAGMVQVIVPGAIAVGIIVLLHGHLRGHAWQPWAVLAAATVLSVALAAQRLAAALAFLENFPRSLYPLPGFTNPVEMVRLVVEALFWRAPNEAGMAALTNFRWPLERHEWEYGIGPVAALILAGGAVALASGWIRRGIPQDRRKRGVAAGIAVAVALTLPFVVNLYTPEWNAILARMPILGSSVALVRWFALFIPVAVLAAALAFDRVLSAGRWRWAGLAIAAVATVWWNVAADKRGYVPGYDGSRIVEAWRLTGAANQIPPVSRIVVIQDNQGTALLTLDRNNVIAVGASQLGCYQPIFGYGLEEFPLGDLRPGMILDEVPGGFNIKNPVCYVFPEENNCRPGDHFRTDQIEDVILFAQYLEFPFAKPAVQIAADRINLGALLLSIAALGAAAAAAIWTRGGAPAANGKSG